MTQYDFSIFFWILTSSTSILWQKWNFKHLNRVIWHLYAGEKFNQNCKVWVLEVSSSKTENGTEIGTIWFCNFIQDLDYKYNNLVLYHHQLTDLLVSGQKFHPICQICVSVLLRFLSWKFNLENWKWDRELDKERKQFQNLRKFTKI